MNTKRSFVEKYPTLTHYILAALIPYTEPNLKLAFRPSSFFDDLSKLGSIKAKKSSMQTAYHRAIKRGLVELDSDRMPRLTLKGRMKIKPYNARKLKGANLMIVFDIPEQERSKRRHLRTLLKELSFVQIQKSVWLCQNDHREYLAAEINEYKLEKYVEIFEARSVKI